jgi:cytochrome c-type biogenesis protein CcmF
VGPAFYNNVLPPIGLGLLGMTAVVPLLPWAARPGTVERRLLLVSLLISVAGVLAAIVSGVRRPLALAVVGLATLAVATLLSAWLHDAWRRERRFGRHELFNALCNGRRKYAAYCIHLGFVCVAIGVSGSSLGARRHEVLLDEGDLICWEGRQIRYVRLEQRQLPDKLVAEAVLEIDRGGTTAVELRPARHLHLLQNEWTTEVAIHSTWRGDFYTVLNAGLGDGRIALTLVNNPMMRWIWFGGIWTTFSAIIAIWPSRRGRAITNISSKPSVEVWFPGDEERRASAA